MNIGTLILYEGLYNLSAAKTITAFDTSESNKVEEHEQNVANNFAVGLGYGPWGLENIIPSNGNTWLIHSNNFCWGLF